MATVYLSDCEQATVQAAIDAATDGDTIYMPAGYATWGTDSTYLNFYRNLTLLGAGPGQTILTSGAGPSTRDAVIRIYGGGTVGGFSWFGLDTRARTAFTMGFADGWRVTNVTYTASAADFFATPTGAFGLIDNCTINGPTSGFPELIFIYGKTDAWQTPIAPGTADAVYIEGCRFTGRGMVCDVNSNGKAVVRNCTIGGEMKIDVHGLASNTPPRSGRSIEVYECRWTSPPVGGFWASTEIRGGTGVAFNCEVDDTSFVGRGHLRLTDYGVIQALPNFGGVFQTPTNYPIADQVGVGMDPKVGGSEPFYIWEYRKGGALAPVIPANIPSGAIDLYRTQTGNPAATFTMFDVIAPNRDYFIQTSATFNGTSGVGVGTRAQMDAITPTLAKVGFWVTDEGSWDTTKAPNTSGRFYVWSGSAWALHYTPYTYPHPLTGAVAAPSFLTNPSSQSVTEGGSVTLASSASGNPSPTYQWYKEGAAISGATNGSLTITDADETDEASYYVTAANAQGTATSTVVAVTVDPATPTLTIPSISFHPQSVSVAEGSNASLSVIATGYPAPSYQWRKGGVDIAGEISSSLGFNTITSDDAGTYTVFVGNSEGYVVSNPAVVTVIAATDTTPPTPNPSTIASVVVGGSTSITVTATTATDADSPPVEYNHAINNTYAGWQSSPVRIFTGLSAGTSYAFKVKARDALLNETSESGVTNATTGTVGGGIGNPLGNRGTRARRLGIF